MKVKLIILSIVFMLGLCLTPAIGMEIVRQKNVATIIYFPIVDGAGATVVAAAGLDSEYDYWTDGAAADGFADLAAEATDINAAGWYSLALSQAEMNHDYIAIKVYSSTAGSIDARLLIRTIVGDPLNLATTDDGGTINVTSGAIDDVTVSAIDNNIITAASINADAITEAKIADSAIAAEHIAPAAIDNATFAADIGSTVYADNIIALAVRKVLDELNLDHLMKVAVNDRDALAEVVDDTVLANILTKTDGDTSDFDHATMSIEAIMEDRTLAAADYVVVGDTIATVTTVGTCSDVTNLGGTAAATQINNQVKDVIITDTYAEIAAGAPSATPTFAYMMTAVYEYMFRNKMTVTTSLITLYKDDGTTAVFKATVADDGTTFTRSEFVAP